MQMEYCGFLIERGLFGWHVVDWDWEYSKTLTVQPTKAKALDWIDKHLLCI